MAKQLYFYGEIISAALPWRTWIYEALLLGKTTEEKSTAPGGDSNPWPQKFCSEGVCSTPVLQLLPSCQPCYLLGKDSKMPVMKTSSFKQNEVSFIVILFSSRLWLSNNKKIVQFPQLLLELKVHNRKFSITSAPKYSQVDRCQNNSSAWVFLYLSSLFMESTTSIV